MNHIQQSVYAGWVRMGGVEMADQLAVELGFIEAKPKTEDYSAIIAEIEKIKNEKKPSVVSAKAHKASQAKRIEEWKKKLPSDLAMKY